MIRARVGEIELLRNHGSPAVEEICSDRNDETRRTEIEFGPGDAITLPVGGDRGVPLVISEPGSPAGRSFIQLAERVAMRAAVAAHENAIKFKGKIPLIQVR